MSETVHPDRDGLLAHGLGEGTGAERRRIEAHLGACKECADYSRALAHTLSVLGAWPEEAPPADGLDRVLTAIAETCPAPRRGEEGVRPALLSLAGVVAGGLVIYGAGAQLTPAFGVAPAHPGPLDALVGFALAALLFFAAGSLVTLALAPALILELQSHRVRATAR